MRAKTISEGFFDDPESQKALSGYAKAFFTKDFNDYTLEITKPFSINVSSDDKSKFQFLLNKYKVLYNIRAKEAATVTETLKFSDDLEFDTSGPLRKKHEYDGWYVIGKGLLLPVDSEEEADEYINKHN